MHFPLNPTDYKWLVASLSPQASCSRTSTAASPSSPVLAPALTLRLRAEGHRPTLRPNGGVWYFQQEPFTRHTSLRRETAQPPADAETAAEHICYQRF